MVTQLGNNEKNLIFACARDPDKAEDLKKLKKNNERIHLIKLDVNDEKQLKEAVAEVSKKVKKIDVLINNAAALGNTKLADTKPSDMKAIYSTNVIAPLLVIQAFLPLLKAGIRKDADGKDSNVPKVINISSGAGSIGMYKSLDWIIGIPYTVSKAALNMLTVNCAKEAPGIVWIPLHPGLVQTDMAKEAGVTGGITATESVKGILSVVHKLTLNDNLTFYDYQGNTLPW